MDPVGARGRRRRSVLGARALAAAALVVVLALWWSGSRADAESAVPEASPGREDRGAGLHVTKEAAKREPGRVAVQPGAVDAAAPAKRTPSRTDLILDALRELEGLVARWPPYNEARDFDAADMAPVRKAVRGLAIQGRELRALLADPRCERSLRPIVLASFAYADDVSATDLDAVLADAVSPENAAGLESATSRPVPATSAFAGTFALQMLDADAQIASATVAFAARRERDRARGSSSARDLAAFAARGLRAPGDPVALEAVRRVVAAAPESIWTHAAWAALARAGTPADVALVVDRATGGNGQARVGLESAADPSLCRELERMASTPTTVYQRYLAASAARGLLSIGTPESSAAFLRLARADFREPVEEALALHLEPTALGTLLTAGFEARERPEVHPIAPAIDVAITAMRDRLGRATVSRRDVRDTLDGIRDALPRIASRPDSLRAALDAAAAAADEASWPEFETYAPTLDPEARAAVQALRAEHR